MMTQDEIETKLRELAIKASKNAHSPYSKVQVGSALITSTGKYYTGCNIENSSFGATICAERVAIFKAVAASDKILSKIYVYSKAGWPPCGMCRQVMSEFADSDLEIIIGDETKTIATYSFKDILPLAFTPEHLQN